MSTGEISSSSITIELEHNLYALKALFKRLKSSNIIAKTIKTKAMKCPLFIPNNEKNIININAYLQVKGEIKFDDEKVCTLKPRKKPNKYFPKGTSFLQLNALHINGVKQFRMIKEEDLNAVNQKLNKKFFDLLANNTKNSSQNEVSIDRLIDIDYHYDHAMIETRFSFTNALWNGNIAYIKINDHYYWVDQHNWMEEDKAEDKSSICDSPDFYNDKWSTPIRIIYKKPHNSRQRQLRITFGYKFNPHINLSSVEAKKCRVLSELNPNEDQVISFSEMYISLK